MAQERIDIAVAEDGSRVVKRNLEELGTGAKTAASDVDRLKESLNSNSGALDKLQTTLGASNTVLGTLDSSVNKLITAVRGMTTAQAASVETTNKTSAANKVAATSTNELAASTVKAEAALVSLGETEAAQTARIKAAIAASIGQVNANHGIIESERSLAERAGLRIEATELQKRVTTASVEAQTAQMISTERYVGAVAVETAAVKTNTKAQVENATAHGMNSRTMRELGVVAGELASGNMGRLKQSTAALANSTGVLTKLFTILGLGILGVVAILALFAAALYKGWQQTTALNKALIVTGSTSGQTAGQIDIMSRSLANANVNSARTQELLVGLVGTGQATSDSLRVVGEAAQNMMALTGDSVDQVVESFSHLYDDPIKWADDMDTKWHFLTLSVRDHAQSLINVGDKYGAAEVIAAAFADNTKAKVDALNASMGALERGIQNASNFWAGVKQWAFDIDKPKDAIQLFSAELQKYNAWLEKSKGLTGDYVKSVDAQFQARLKALQPAAQDLLLVNKTVEAQDQNRKALLSSGAVIDSVNDKTQKQLTLQIKLKALHDSYQTQKNLGADTSGARFAGVSFDAAGNPSGGAYQSKVDELNKEALGTPKKDHTAEREAKKRQTYLSQLETSLERYSGKASTAARAQNDLTNAQTTFDAAVKEGFITQDQANKYMDQLRQRTKDALDPLGALNREIDKQTALMKLNADEQQVQATLMGDVQALQAKGQVLTDKDIAQLRAKITAQQELGRLMQIQNSLQQGSRSEQDKNRGRGNQAVSNLLGDKSSGFNKDDAFNAMSAGLPKDAFAGTKEAAKQNIKVMQDMFQQINDMRKLDVISDRTATMAKMNIWLSYSQTVAQTAAGIFGNLATLQQSSNKKAQSIGKAAAIAQAIMNTYAGAVAAAKSAADIPYVGWLLAPAAAGAFIVAGMAQVAQIRSTPSGQGFAYGGDFTVGGVGGTDSQNVAFRATPGERVTVNTPQQAQAIEDAARRKDDGKRRGGDFKQTVIVNVKGKPDRKTPGQQARAIRQETMKEYSRS